MRKILFAGLVATVLVTVGLAQEKPATPPAEQPKSAEKEAKTVTAETAASPLEFTMKDIDGNDVSLSKYKGQVVLIVNVASKCGLTPQYEQLETLHERYQGKGLAILAFPANNFGSQEPGTNESIKMFCKSRFHVGFDLFSKVSVKGDDQVELYKWLTSDKRGKVGGEIKWNFTKFLVDREGKLIERFEPRTKPDEPEVVQAIEKALDAKK